MTARDIISRLIKDEYFKSAYLRKFDTLPPGRKGSIERLIWLTWDAIDSTLEHEYMWKAYINGEISPQDWPSSSSPSFRDLPQSVQASVRQSIDNALEENNAAFSPELVHNLAEILRRM